MGPIVVQVPAMSSKPNLTSKAIGLTEVLKPINYKINVKGWAFWSRSHALDRQITPYLNLVNLLFATRQVCSQAVNGPIEII